MLAKGGNGARSNLTDTVGQSVARRLTGSNQFPSAVCVHIMKREAVQQSMAVNELHTREAQTAPFTKLHNESR